MIAYDDLIGLPYEYDADGPSSFNCAGIVREIYRRAQMPTKFLPIKENEALMYVTHVLGDPKMHPWDRVDACSGGRVVSRLQFGDIILARGLNGSHVSVVADEDRQMAVSAGSSVGVFASPISRLSNVLSVYRLSEDAQ